MYKKRLAMDTSNGYNDGEAGGRMNFSRFYANKICAPENIEFQTIFLHFFFGAVQKF